MGYSYTNYSYGATCQGNVKVWNILNQIPDVLCGKPHSDQTHPTRLFYLLCASSRNKLQCITSQYYMNSVYMQRCRPAHPRRCFHLLCLIRLLLRLNYCQVIQYLDYARSPNSMDQ